MRIRHKPWAKEYIDKEDDLFINKYINNKEFGSFIKGYKEIRIEVGCGKGQFIYNLAKDNPDILFIGVERQASILVLASQKNNNKTLSNLKFYYGDINKLIDNDILKNKVDCIYLNFSDPWPKKRHSKRRLTYKTFLDIYVNLLKSEGLIIQKTDNDSLFESSLVSFANDNRWVFEEVYLDLHSQDIENYETEYEERFSNKGFKIKYLKVRKK